MKKTLKKSQAVSIENPTSKIEHPKSNIAVFILRSSRGGAMPEISRRLNN
jgi:hypothetical protein